MQPFELSRLRTFQKSYSTLAPSNRLSSCYGWDDGNLRSVGHACSEVVEKSHIFAIHIYIDEPAQLAAVLAQTGAEPGILGFEGFYDVSNGARRHLNGIGITCNPPQRRRNRNFNRHVNLLSWSLESGVWSRSPKGGTRAHLLDCTTHLL